MGKSRDFLAKTIDCIGLRRPFGLQTTGEYNQSVEDFFKFGLDCITEKILPDHHWVKVNKSPALQGMFFLTSRTGIHANAPIPHSICLLLEKSLAAEGIPLHVIKRFPEHGVAALYIGMLSGLGDIRRVAKIKKHFEDGVFQYFIDHIKPMLDTNGVKGNAPEISLP